MAKHDKPPKREAMIRTSIQLPQPLLDALERRWPTLPVSERIRLALERHEYLMQTSLVGTSNAIEKHGDVLEAALHDFDFKDFKVASRAMPSLVEGYLQDETHDLSDGDAENLVEWIQEAETRERLHMLDAAIHQRLFPETA